MDRVIEYFQNKFEKISLCENSLIKTYTNFNEEVESVKYGVGIYNRSESAVLHLNGKDTIDFLQRITTNDVSKIEPYHYVPTLFTNEKGRLIDRTILVRLDEDYFLVGGKKNDKVLERWINKYIITEKINTENRTGEYLILDVIGPQAESYLTLIGGKKVDDLDNNKLHKLDIEDTDTYLLKKNTTKGENLYWLFCKVDYYNTLFDYLLTNRSIFDLQMIGEEAFDYYRVMNVVPKYPNEINDRFNPHEALLMNEVSFTKGCYIGQEVVTRINTYEKVQKVLKKMKLFSDNKLKTPLTLQNKSSEDVAIITTLVNSTDNNHYEALGFVRKNFINQKEFSDLIDSETNSKTKIKILD